jgi:hypothetical protein
MNLEEPPPPPGELAGEISREKIENILAIHSGLANQEMKSEQRFRAPQQRKRDDMKL